MKVNVVNTSGAETGNSVTLPKAIFGVEPNDHAIYLDVKQHLANRRQGTHKAKEKSEMAYSTRKIKRQKGTGTARAGSIKSGVMVGGGRIHGPRPRNYSFKLNRKLKQVARRSALTYKAQGKEIMVLDAISMEQPNTQGYLSVMQNLNLADKKTLLVVAETNKNVYLSSRNLPKAKVMVASDINTYEILNAQNIIIVEDAVKVIENTLS